MNRAELVQQKKDAIRRIAQEHGATEIRLFGSVASGDESETSDIDFLVELEDGRSLLDLGGMLMDLQEELGVEVDLTTIASLPDEQRERLLRESSPV
jgi:hypothetical protein